MSEWKPIETAPKDGKEIDIWMHIYASPMSMGFSDSFRVIECRFKNGGWVHYHEGKEKRLESDYITHWMPLPEPPK